MKVSFALVFLLGWTSACGSRTEESSAVKIRQGSVVSASSQGVERVSTVGLIGVSNEGQYTCSAAIISSTRLVTAAHCVSADAKLYAFFGTNRAKAKNSDFIAVDGQIAHPDYHPATAGLPAHDVAVVHLSQPIPKGFVAAPILGSDSSLAVNDTVLLAGYGITEFGNDSGVLRSTPATFAGLDEIGRLQINDPKTRGACSGDSGGPLFASINGRYYVAGVLSGGPIPCRGINTYTSLAAHSSFISQVAFP